MTTRNADLPPHPREAVPVGTGEELPELVAQLGNDLLRLIDGKLGLLKLDLEDAARGYLRHLVLAATAALVMAGGLILGAAGLAFALASFLPGGLDPLHARAIAFGTIGGAAGVGGWIVFRHAIGLIATAARDV